MSTVAVTGAGFIGTRLCERLVAEGHSAIAIDVDPSAAGRVRSTGAEFRAGDTTDPGSIRRALEGAELVVHTAAIVREFGPMAEYVRVNVGGTENVLHAAGLVGATRAVHLSSVAVWGYDFKTDITEDEPPTSSSSNPYIATKAASELLARSRGATVVRPGDVYGPGSTQWARRPLELMRSGRFALPGRGRGLLTLVYVDDLVDCLYRAATLPEGAGQVFTAWDGKAVTVGEFFGHYARMLGKRRAPTAPAAVIRAVLRAQSLLPGGPQAHADGLIFTSRKATYPNARARELLGWEPRVTLAEGMRRTEDWFRSEGLLA